MARRSLRSSATSLDLTRRHTGAHKATMIQLSSTESLRVSTSVDGTVDANVAWDDNTGGAYEADRLATQITTSGTATIAAPPTSGSSREVGSISVYNRRTSPEQSMSVIVDDGVTERILIGATLLAGERISYESGLWRIFDARGQQKRNGDRGATGPAGPAGAPGADGAGLDAIPPATIAGNPADAGGSSVPVPLSAAQVRTIANVDDGATKETRVKRTVKAATAALTQGCAVVTDGATVKLGTPALVRAAGRISGLAVAAASASATATVHTAGPIDPAIINLGAGLACAVGITSAGVPVRVTDATHASGLDYVGWCDTSGTILCSPRRAEVYRLDDWGGIPNDTSAGARAANTAAFVKIQASLLPNRGAEIRIPEGEWYFAADLVDATVAIHIVRPVRVVGAGARYDNLFATRLHIPDGMVGMKLWHNGMASPVGTEGSASGAFIGGFQLTAEGKTSPTAHGIEMRTGCELRNVVLDQFGGHGVMIDSLPETGGGFPGNWHLHSVRVAYCLDGIHVIGGESNNGSTTLADCSLNRGWGIYDDSFLGCTWVGCHTADNMAGAYFMAASVPSTMVGCYSESDQAPSHCERTNVVGGDHGAGFDDSSTHIGGYGEMSRAELYAGDYYVTDIVATGTNPPAVRVTYRDLTAEQRPPTSAPSANVIVEVTTGGYPGGYDAFAVPQTAMVVRYSIDGGATWVTGQSPSRGDNPYFYGPARLALGATKLYAYFPVTLYTVGNTYTCSAYGGIRVQAGVGSRDGTFAAFSWQHFDVSLPAGDPFIWRHGIYNQTSKRWETKYANSKVSQEYVSDRSLPAPGQVLHPGPYWAGSDADGFSRLGWYSGAETTGTREWRLSVGADEQWYGPGDLLLNRSAASPFPLGLRAVRRGGWSSAWSGGGYESTWIAGTGHHTSDVVLPTTPNGFIYRAEVPGTSHAAVEPTWPTTVNATVTDGTITWRNVGISGSPFEPIGSESETMYSYDCSAGGALTPTLEAVNAKIVKLTGAPGATFSVVIPAGPAGAWTRTIWNATTKDATIKAAGGDTGIVVAAGSILPVFSDGTNAAVLSLPAVAATAGTCMLTAGSTYAVSVGLGGTTPGYGIISAGGARIRWYTNEMCECVGLTGALLESTGADVRVIGATEVTITAASSVRVKANATGLGFFGATPIARPTALTASVGGTINSGDATTDTEIANMRTRIAQLESKLQALGLLS